ncbi:MAG: preprotein translocase subunit SecY [Clostridiaceae bacterium]|jgi:preprotein translocase subunit SecY|nr:preprotein translocase subunit SecY [Clostridia bacterium]MBP6161769.1 preprotein translocase subunit SecY [Clostridia bacterium]MBP6949980.1 preprotein translocase subunit SecY [Clostridia bacterium]NMA36264.1 preprotein translocase subunit SecY [Clostridiaceae bacterium]
MGSMLQTLVNAWRIPDLRKKLQFTLVAILIYRLGTAIPTPMIDSAAFASLIERFGQLGQFLDIISGGAFKSVSVLALGISPYINASIIMQLLTFAIPALERLSKEGEVGQKKIQKITRAVTLLLSLVMAVSYALMTRGATTPGIPEWLSLTIVILSFAAGASFVVWLGEQIDARGVGNGISLIIFIGIASRLPSGAKTLFLYFQNLTVTKNIFLALGLVLLVAFVFIAIITVVVFVQSAERRIPVQYTKRVVGRKMYGGQSTYLPIKVNQSGVLPVIFAMSVLMVPSTIASFTGSTGKFATWLMNFNQNPLYYVVYTVMIIAFTFFYATISFNPIDIANNLQKNGGYILGIRPGRPTAEFVGKTARRLNWFESVFLAILVLMPSVLGMLTGAHGIWFGGTAVLILVGVAMDIVNQLEAQMLMRHYKGFLD